MSPSRGARMTDGNSRPMNTRACQLGISRKRPALGVCRFGRNILLRRDSAMGSATENNFWLRNLGSPSALLLLLWNCSTFRTVAFWLAGLRCGRAAMRTATGLGENREAGRFAAGQLPDNHLERLDVLRLRTLRALGDVELNLLVLVQGAVTAGCDC
jgi:hypothetical protein